MNFMEQKKQQLTKSQLENHPSETVRKLFDSFQTKYQELLEVSNQIDAAVVKRQKLIGACEALDQIIGVEVSSTSIGDEVEAAHDPNAYEVGVTQ